VHAGAGWGRRECRNGGVRIPPHCVAAVIERFGGKLRVASRRRAEAGGAGRPAPGSRSKGQRALEQGALLAARVCMGGVARSLERGIDDASDVLGALAGAGAGYALADLVSGLVHWACDRFGSPDTPVLGPRLIAPFREHHDRPSAMLEHDFVELVGSSFLAVAALWAASWLLVSEHGPAWQAFALALGLATGLTNVAHRWAHIPEPPRAVAWLQRRGLLLAPEEHALHHQPPFATHYCVTTGWWNGLLLRSGVLTWLESRLRKVDGRPRAPRGRPPEVRN